MSSRRGLARQLAALAGFDSPDASLEQYPTPADLAAHLVHLADLHGDLADRVVLDLGAGTGILALGAAIRDPARVVGIERDWAALAIARRNTHDLAPPVDPDWVQGDATRPPVCADDTTVLMNPPFGAQDGQKHADRAFLEAASRVGSVSYSVHNAGSRGFLNAFVRDAGAALTHAFAAEIPLKRSHPWHETDEEAIEVVVVRIDWTGVTRNGTSPGSQA